MATYVFYGYSSDVFVFNSSTNAFELDPNYDFTTDRIKVTITDDDAFFDGDRDNPNIGEDANQTAVVETPDGTLIASGQLYDDAFAEIALPGGGTAWLERLEIGGTHLGYFSTEELVPGGSYPVNFSQDVDDDLNGEDTRVTYSQLSSVPCFGPATSIETKDGPVPVEWLNSDIEIWTQDHGGQRPVWVGSVPFSTWSDPDDTSLWPVNIPPDALALGVPEETVTVSPQHRILVRHPFCELYYGTAEVFVAAKHLLGLNGISQSRPSRDFQYHHVILQHHEIVTTHGLESESMFYSKASLKLLDPVSRRAAMRNMRPYGYHRQTARLCLSAMEAEVLRDALHWPLEAQEVGRTA